MSHRFGFGVTVALTALLAFGPSCQKNEEMRPASGVNPNYQGDEASSQDASENAYPQPGSGSGVPGTHTTPGATEPGADSEIPRREDPTTLPPGGFPVEKEPSSSELPASNPTWDAVPTTGGTGGGPSKPKGAAGKGSAGHPSH